MAIAIVTTTALALVMFGHRNVAQANDEGCNAATVQGTYGSAIGGFVSTTFSGSPQLVGEFVPLAAAGTFSFDGQGTTSRSFTVSFGGATFPLSDSGPYTVSFRSRLIGCHGSLKIWRSLLQHGITFQGEATPHRICSIT